ncbi:PREDICTED: uncharacterized protein LOC106791088 [Polistes canadensis]|uniref:uncharacterized protein LOC106791088 n=1 Tax=Polistes canadensis TaxID=91411 RepID=UPI000718CD86|nr:PREDICTED: uncharacterized protein LOC106791088 [Polistes canadensis]
MDDSQQLFLIEFLVDRINIPAIRAIHQEMLPVTTCVSFQVLGLPPINIHEEASVEKCSCLSGDVQVFKKGKSCLFALPNNVLRKPIHSFPVTMSVYKKLPPGVLPDVMLIGTHQIQLRNLINDLLSQRIFKNGNPCRSLKSTFRITTATGQGVGEATVFIRVSCFGKKIVTQFQIPHNKKPYLFKGTKDSPVFQCKRIPSDIFLPEPVRCNCPVKKSPDGSGEGKTCCLSKTSPETKSGMDKCKQAHCEPLPCCLSSKQPISNCLDSQSNQQQQQCQPEYLNSKNDSLQTPYAPSCMQTVKPALTCSHPAAANTCLSCCSPQPIKDITCAPCCGTKGTTFDELFKEKPVRKCGCIIKEQPTCNCKQTCF